MTLLYQPAHRRHRGLAHRRCEDSTEFTPIPGELAHRSVVLKGALSGEPFFARGYPVSVSSLQSWGSHRVPNVGSHSLSLVRVPQFADSPHGAGVGSGWRLKPGGCIVPREMGLTRASTVHDDACEPVTSTAPIPDGIVTTRVPLA